MTRAPGEPASAAILEELSADPLYRKLTEHQECYRARLTPKPPAAYPWNDASAEARYRGWEAACGETIRRYATCRFIRDFGPPAEDPEIVKVIEYHDSLCHNDSAPLA